MNRKKRRGITESFAKSGLLAATVILLLVFGLAACGKKAPPEPLDSKIEPNIEVSRAAS